MTIAEGSNLGPYQIISLLGAGGMGEVYKARDTRLDRTVAIKVLPEHLSSNPDLRQRFEREARAVSSLNHPHICSLYDVGNQNGTDYIIMEFLEGETLAERLVNGPLPKTDLFRLGIQIADALDKAHKQGIVHRDLKPGNIFLTKAGAKLLDFGLAKLQAVPVNAPAVSTLPTKERNITEEGTVLGTVQYMAPEQLEGKEADHRTDIFAFGLVLYEMATGKKAFQGGSKASLIAAILKEEAPSLLELQPLTPPLLDRLIKACMEKHPDDRLQSSSDISHQLRWISESSSTHISTPAVSQPVKTGKRLAVPVAAMVALVAGICGTLLLAPRFQQKPPAAVQTYFTIPAPDFLRQNLNQADPDFSVSPDGTKIVYPLTDRTDRKNRLYVRQFSQADSQVVAGTEGASLAFWSPDGNQIAFVSESRLKRVPLSGGVAQVICNMPEEFRGGVWLPDDTILFSPANSPILRVSAKGGEPQPVTELAKEERGHNWPTALPGNKEILFLSNPTNIKERTLYLRSLESNKTVPILKTAFTGRYIEPGYLIFVRGDTLYAQRLELDPPRLTGEAVRITDKVIGNILRGASPFSSSANGVIAYRTFGDMYKTQLTWLDRAGKQIGPPGPVTTDVSVSLSPDEKRAVVSTVSEIGHSEGRSEIPVNLWAVDLARGLRTRLTFEPSTSDENAAWSPDGRRIVYGTHVAGANAQIYQKPSSGEGQPLPLFLGTGNEHPIDWSPDGKYLLLHSDTGTAASLDILLLSLDGKSKPAPFIATRFIEGQAQFSPDGRWVAYTSGESGRLEVYVKPFLSNAEKWQVSSNGGAEPRWRGDGKELFYIALDGVMTAVQVSPTQQDIHISTPIALFDSHLPPVDLNHYGGSARYDVTGDGQRFLMNTVVVPQQPPTLNVITNWNSPDR